LTILIFSSCNGTTTLPRMLERLARIERPPGLQVVAVDNRSTDGTPQLLRDWAPRLPMTVLECASPGKNRALNHALDTLGPTALARAELVVFTDDDVLPQDDWLVRLAAAARSQPEAALFGGAIRPEWPHPPPGWLTAFEDAYEALFALTTARHGPCSSDDVFGPNMAVRGSVLAAGARFEPGIGPDGSGRFGMGSESEFLHRMAHEGHRMYFCADAIVGHQIRASQMTRQSVLARGYRLGYGYAMMDAQARSRLALLPAALARLVERELKALAAGLPVWRSRRLKTLYLRDVRRGYLASLLRGPSLPALSGPARPRAARGVRGTAAPAATAPAPERR
jgi:GT2 family glycosyltransferase